MKSVLSPHSSTALTTKTQQFWGSFEILFATWAVCLPQIKGYLIHCREGAVPRQQTPRVLMNIMTGEMDDSEVELALPTSSQVVEYSEPDVSLVRIDSVDFKLVGVLACT